MSSTRHSVSRSLWVLPGGFSWAPSSGVVARAACSRRRAPSDSKPNLRGGAMSLVKDFHPPTGSGKASLEGVGARERAVGRDAVESGETEPPRDGVRWRLPRLWALERDLPATCLEASLEYSATLASSAARSAGSARNAASRPSSASRGLDAGMTRRAGLGGAVKTDSSRSPLLLTRCRASPSELRD